jgi:hypothetical protein
MFDGRQRQRHGAAKNLAEGLGGVVVGASLVVLVGSALKCRRARVQAPALSSTAAGHLTSTETAGENPS